MAKRPNPCAIRANQAYTIPELAAKASVTVGCVRNWIKAGLPAMMSQRPYLILGSDVRDFLNAKRRRSTQTLAKDQLFCMSCKAARRPAGLMVDLIAQTGRTARIVGLCDHCGTVCNRMVSKAKMPDLHQIFDLSKRGPA